MALESISPPDRMCLHFRLVLVLTSSFQRNHRSVCACVCAVVHKKKNKTHKLTSSYLDWLKDSELFLFSRVMFSHCIIMYHFSSPGSFAIIHFNRSSLGIPRKFFLSLFMSQLLRSHMHAEQRCRKSSGLHSHPDPS